MPELLCDPNLIRFCTTEEHTSGDESVLPQKIMTEPTISKTFGRLMFLLTIFGARKKNEGRLQNCLCFYFDWGPQKNRATKFSWLGLEETTCVIKIVSFLLVCKAN